MGFRNQESEVSWTPSPPQPPSPPLEGERVISRQCSLFTLHSSPFTQQCSGLASTSPISLCSSYRALCRCEIFQALRLRHPGLASSPPAATGHASFPVTVRR